jgi:hypothetical protein
MKKIIIMLLVSFGSSAFAIDLSSLASKGKGILEVAKDVPAAAGQLTKLPGQLKGIGQKIKNLNKRVQCLPKAGKGACPQVGCSSRNECLGITLENFVELVKPATLFLGNTQRDDTGKVVKFQPGLVIVLMSILEKILNEAPVPSSLTGSFAKLSTALKLVNAYTQKFAQSLDDVFGFLAGISMQLKPDMILPADIHADALPPLEVAPETPADEFTFDTITEVQE